MLGESEPVPEDGTSDPVEAVDATQEAEIIKVLTGNPNIATALLRAAAQTQEGRALLNTTPAKPLRPYAWRDYDAEELKVHGGTEVRHPNDFVPLPPAAIKMYLLSDGNGGIEMDGNGNPRRTIYAEPHVEQRRKPIPMRDENGKIIVNEEGNQIYTEEVVDVVVDQGAAKGADGKPIKSPEYEMWIEARRDGGRLGSEVQSKIAAGKYGEIDGGGQEVHYGGDGAPVVAGESEIPEGVLAEA